MVKHLNICASCCLLNREKSNEIKITGVLQDHNKIDLKTMKKGDLVDNFSTK